MNILTSVLPKAHTVFNRLVHGHSSRYERLKLEAEQARPATILEIGVWHGERARQLITAALSSRPAEGISYFGFDLFERMTPDLVAPEASHRSRNPSMAEIRERLSSFADRGVTVKLFAGNTRETLAAAITELPPIDFAFIDGGHSYETVKSDWENVERVIHARSVVIFDDYVCEEAVEREGFGVNRLMAEIDRSRYKVEILEPVDWWPRPWGIFKNQLAKVTAAS